MLLLAAAATAKVWEVAEDVCIFYDQFQLEMVKF